MTIPDQLFSGEKRRIVELFRTGFTGYNCLYNIRWLIISYWNGAKLEI